MAPENTIQLMKRNGVFDAAATCQLIYSLTEVGDAQFEQEGHFFTFFHADGQARDRNEILEALLGYWQSKLNEWGNPNSRGFFFQNAASRFVPAEPGALDGLSGAPLIAVVAPSRQALLDQRNAAIAMLHALGLRERSGHGIRDLLLAVKAQAMQDSQQPRKGLLGGMLSGLFTARARTAPGVAASAGCSEPMAGKGTGIGSVQSALRIEAIAERSDMMGLDDLRLIGSMLDVYAGLSKKEPAQSMEAFDRELARLEEDREKLVGIAAEYYDATLAHLKEAAQAVKNDTRRADDFLAVQSVFTAAREACIDAELSAESFATMETAQTLSLRALDRQRYELGYEYGLHAMLLRVSIDRLIGRYREAAALLEAGSKVVPLRGSRL